MEKKQNIPYVCHINYHNLILLSKQKTKKVERNTTTIAKSNNEITYMII